MFVIIDWEMAGTGNKEADIAEVDSSTKYWVNSICPYCDKLKSVEMKITQIGLGDVECDECNSLFDIKNPLFKGGK